MKRKLFSLFICLFLSFGTFASVIEFNHPKTGLPIGTFCGFLEDPNNNLKIDQVIHQNFSTSNIEVPNFGISNSSYWVKIELVNKSDLSNLIIRVNQPIIDEVEFYQDENNDGKFEKISSGEYLPFALRKYLSADYLFDINPSKGKSYTYFLKLRSKENLQVPISIESPQSTYNSMVQSSTASGIYIGIMLVMFLYNLFIYTIFRDKSYIYYSFYILLILFTQTSLQGLPFQFVWPNYPTLAIYSPFIFPSAVGLAGLAFFRHFMHLKEKRPLINKWSHLFWLPYTVSFLLSLIGQYNLSFMIMEFTASVVSFFMLTIAYMAYRDGVQEARFFLVGWSLFLLGIIIYVMKDMQVLPYNGFTRYTMHFGSAVEVILLSFALADKINILKKEKEASQAEALSISRENERLIREQNIILEEKVVERTHELNEALTNLKETQAQLVDAEKMASLGQLTAGIAHEINNPINFVSANIKPLKMDILDIVEVIKQYEELTPENLSPDKLNEIDAFKKNMDLEYTFQEINVLLNGIEDGAKRTAEIVSGLKNFSRLDETEMKEADINEGIESTLVLLRNNIPDTITVEKDLAELGKIECLPGKLNQVFMNILNNAIQAMNAVEGKQHTLKIKTWNFDDNHVGIRISDTGAGMTPEIKAKVFEPFFTTKDVGQGTGLGMSIVFNIIKSHNAQIAIQTAPGVGTTIEIILHKKLSQSIS